MTTHSPSHVRVWIPLSTALCSACALIAGIDDPVGRPSDGGRSDVACGSSCRDAASDARHHDGHASSTDGGHDGGAPEGGRSDARLDSGADAHDGSFCASSSPAHTFCDDWDEGNPVNFLWNGTTGAYPNFDGGLIVVDLGAEPPSPPGAAWFNVVQVTSGVPAALKDSLADAATRSIQLSFDVRIDAESNAYILCEVSLTSHGALYGFGLLPGADADVVDELFIPGSDSGATTYAGPFTLDRHLTPGHWTRVTLVLDLQGMTWSISYDGSPTLPNPMAIFAAVEVPTNVSLQIGEVPEIAGSSVHFDNVALDVDRDE